MVFLTIVPRLTEAVMTNEFVSAEPVKRYDSARGIALHHPITFVNLRNLCNLWANKNSFPRFLDSLEKNLRNLCNLR